MSKKLFRIGLGVLFTGLLVLLLDSCFYEEHMLCTPGERGKYFLDESRIVSWPPRMVFTRRSNPENFVDTIDLRLTHVDTPLFWVDSQLEGACSYYDERLRVWYSDSAKFIFIGVIHRAVYPNLVSCQMESSGRFLHHYNGFTTGSEDTVLVHENYDHAEKFKVVIKKDSGLTYLHGLKAAIIYKRLW